MLTFYWNSDLLTAVESTVELKGKVLRLSQARVQNYRSIRDTGWFEVEPHKTIMVGPNEAGKTAVLQALQQINSPDGVTKFDPLRDYPRALYNDISTGKVNPSQVVVSTAQFALEPDDLAEISSDYENAVYVFERRLDNSALQYIVGGPPSLKFDAALSKDLTRMAAHADKNYDGEDQLLRPSIKLKAIIEDWISDKEITVTRAKSLQGWLNEIIEHIDESDSAEDQRHTHLLEVYKLPEKRSDALETLNRRLPVFILFNNYFRVKPRIHLGHLATRIETNVLNGDQYDYGNQCLLKLLGFTARELSNLGQATEPDQSDRDALKTYMDQLDKRSYQLNAANVQLTGEIRSIWNPNPQRVEADRLRVDADAQYLKVVVEDDLGVEIELDQRSEGFQWLVSFFVVFFAEASGKHENAILLLDEPGLSLHGLKQRDFRETIGRLAEKNQTLYTTHSPFLVGPDELDLVRVVEMTDRSKGTVVHTSVMADDPASLLPLQEALGYDLAQSLFSQQRNLVLEGLTDYWYLDGTSQLLAAGGGTPISDKITLLPADSAGKVVYFATILHANNLKVAALLDSDDAGNTAANQEILVHQLGNKNILRTKDVYNGTVGKPEVEDLLRETLVKVANDELGWDISAAAAQQQARPIVNIFSADIPGFSKYKLAKAFLRWTRTHDGTELSANEQQQWTNLIARINKALK
ncbi:MAG: AAA family ATPase [Thermomicrobiales bacterium]